MAVRASLSVLCSLALLAACARSPALHMGAAHAPHRAASDPGALLLADVDNAAAAIDRGDAVAAENDLVRASGYQDQLQAGGSQLFPLTAPPGAGTGPITSFEVQVALTSAQAAVLDGRPAHAAADLKAVQQAVTPAEAPANLGALQASEALALADEALKDGDRASLRTDLVCAAGALGSGRQADGQALAAAIDRTLASPTALQALQSGQVEVWSGAAARLG